MLNKFIGKLLNIERGKRLAYVQGMLDWMELIGIYTYHEFVVGIYNAIAEFGDSNEIIKQYYDEWKEKISE